MTKFRVSPGGKIEIGIEGDKPAVTPAPAKDSGYIGSDPIDEQLYVFRKGNITLYDLGTRHDGDVYSHLQFSLLVEDFGAEGMVNDYNATLLTASPPFSTALKLAGPNLASLYVDVVFQRSGEDDLRVLVGAVNTRPYVKDAPLVAAPQPPPVTETDWTSDALSLKAPGEWDIGIESGYFYNPFQTADETNFKVTDAPVSSAARVEFSLTARDKVKIYLVPRLGLPDGVTLIEADGRYLLFRLPVIPNFPLVFATAYSDNDTFQSASAAMWDQIAEFENPISQPHDPLDWHDLSLWSDGLGVTFDVSVGPRLVAIIVKNQETFYVWRTDTVEDPKWLSYAVFNPSPG